MEETTIIKGKRESVLYLCLCAALPILGVVVWVVYNTSLLHSSFVMRNYGSGYRASRYVWGSANGANEIFYILIPILVVIAALFIVLHFREKIVVTDKRVYGITFWGKRVDLPLDSISSIGTSSLFKSVSVATSSGIIRFGFLKNRSEIQAELSKLIVGRQNAPASTIDRTIASSKDLISEVDEIKKYKELLDAGVISQEEFDLKKRQIMKI